jgi:tetratricopeptide (TPR) repeat protein
MSTMRIIKNRLVGILLGFLVVFSTAPGGQRQAETLYPQKELARALKQFKSTMSSFEKGRDLFARGDTAGAVRAFQICTQAMPAHIYAHYYLANIHYIQQDYPEALRSIEQADGSIVFMIALDQFAQREKVKDIDKAKKAIEDYWDKTNSCRESRELGQMYSHVEDEQKKAGMQASQEEQRWRTLKSDYAYFHGNVLFQLKEYDRAAEIYRQAVQENPHNGNAYNNLAAI